MGSATRLPLIDNGKLPDEPYVDRNWPRLPPDTPYGNFGLKHIKLLIRADEANRLIQESARLWKVGTSYPLNPEHALERHWYTIELAVYLMRRIADELIATVWCLSEWERLGVYPPRIQVDSIWSALTCSADRQPSICKNHAPVLDRLNRISNAYKHSFVQSDINLIGANEPCVHALSLDRNKLGSEPKLYNVSLSQLVLDFNLFFREGIDWLSEFSKRHPREQRPTQDANQLG